MRKFRKIYKTKIVIILAVTVLLLFTKTLCASIVSEGTLRVSFDKRYTRIEETLGHLNKIQKQVKIREREEAWHMLIGVAGLVR